VSVQQYNRRAPSPASVRVAVQPPPPVLQGYDPEVVARAGALLRALDRATTALTDALDVSGFPPEERRSDIALLSSVASGLPAITLDDVVESLSLLATVSGPTVLFPEGEATLSLPDEARELLYLVEPLATLSHANGRLPRHAGNRLLAAPMAFSLGQSKTSTALDDIVVLLRLLMHLPLRQRALTTLRRRDTAPPRRHSRRPEPTRGAEVILLAMLLIVVGGVLVLLALLSGNPLPISL
jgi:hypothetical protein